jgi:hypothetical protein
MTEKQLAESYRRIVSDAQRCGYIDVSGFFRDEANRLDPPPPREPRMWLMSLATLDAFEQPPGEPDCVLVREVERCEQA